MPKRDLAEMIAAQADRVSSPVLATVNLQTRIQELEQEVVALRSAEQDEAGKAALEAQIAQLTQALAQASGEHEIAIDRIDPDPDQPRTVFPRALIQERAESLRRDGQISAIIVIPQANDRYRLFDGAIRRLAAPLADKTTLRAVFLLNPVTLDASRRFEHQVVAGYAAEKLHDLDTAHALVRILCDRHPAIAAQKDDIPSLLNNAIYQVKKAGKQGDLAKMRIADSDAQRTWLESIPTLTPEGFDILAVLLDRQYNPASVASNLFPLLAIADDLKDLVRQTGIEASKIKELNKLSAEALNLDEPTAQQVRLQTAQEVTDAELSLQGVRKRVSEVLQQYNPHDAKLNSETAPAAKTLRQIEAIDLSQLQELDTLQLKDIRTALKKQLKAVEAQLAQLKS